MRIKSVKLHPFAGIREKSFDFSENLNVVLGPNEAGKSTLYQAIVNGLLTTTSLTTTKVESEMGRFFPVSGGDTIRVSMELLDEEGKSIHLQKTWKKGNREGNASLKLPDRTEITDEESVQEKLEELLPVSPATLRTILLADQSGLHRTMQEMRQADGVRKELGDILRQNLMETGGISVDRFRDLLDQKYENYFKKWDREQEYPENNRGIRNPYKVGTGKIVEAFYQKEQMRIDLEEAEQFENKLDTINEKLTELIHQKDNKKEQFEKWNPLKEGVRQKQLKEQQLSAKAEKKDRLLDISKEWPVMEDRIKNLEPKKNEQLEKIDELQEEQKKAQQKKQAEQLKSRIEKLEKLAVEVKSTKKELNEAKKVEETDVKKLRELNTKINRLQTQIEAARLTVKITSKTDDNIEYAEAGKEEEKISSKKGETIEKIVSGGFSLKTKELELQVISGEGDLEQVIEVVQQKQSELKEALKELDAESLQDAESYAGLYQKKLQDVQQAEKIYVTELGEDDFGALKQELEELGEFKQIRSTEDITNALIEAKTELGKLTDQADAAEIKLKVWKEKYESVEAVIEELGDVSAQIRDLKKELEKLPELPEGFESTEAFIVYVETLNQEIREFDVKIASIKVEKAELEGRAPETSSEELKRILAEAKENFKRVRKEGETLARVRDKTHRLLESMDAGTFQGLETKFSYWLNRMTGDRFSTISLDEDLPEQFVTNDGGLLTYELLSHGTKDVVALAWRFALTDHFLQENFGFIILDDPMVDMDPKRRDSASKAIEEYSNKQQILVLTCHPEHSDGLKGEIISMN